jgi:phosphatidate cytidylyltransferase
LLVFALIEPSVHWLGGGVLASLTIAIIIGLIIRAMNPRNPGVLVATDIAIQRIVTWWLVCAIFYLTLFAGIFVSLIIFTLISFVALREYVILIPTPRADRTICFWTFLLFTLLQYFLLDIKWQGFMIVIPVYAFLVIPATLAFTGDPKSFLDRASRIQWGLMICVYCMSAAPALLILNIPGFGPNEKLLLYLIVVGLLSDVLQEAWGKLVGRHLVAPKVSRSLTWEGFAGGALSATVIGTALWWMTPFSIGASAAISLTIALMALTGRLVMSAIKRDTDVEGYDTLIQVPNNILDRIAPLMFAAPIFFHIVRFFYAQL